MLAQPTNVPFVNTHAEIGTIQVLMLRSIKYWRLLAQEEEKTSVLVVAAMTESDWFMFSYKREFQRHHGLS